MDEETRQRWTVLNQDALKSRQRVWEEANKSLEHGRNVIIDRCNFDASQRKHWIDLAYNHEVYSIVAITILDQNFESCVERATTRGDDGIHDGDTNWSQVCGSMDSQFTLPVLEEGFSAVYDCNSQEDKDTIARAVVEFAMREPY
jgi:predicted kinase